MRVGFNEGGESFEFGTFNIDFQDIDKGVVCTSKANLEMGLERMRWEKNGALFISMSD